MLISTTVLFALFWCCRGQNFAHEGYEEVTRKGLETFGAYDKCGEGASAGKKLCVPYHKCDPVTKNIIEESVNTDGHGLIDIRIREDECPHYLDVCCNVAAAQSSTSGPDPGPTSSPDPGVPLFNDSLPTTSTPNPNVQSSCGIRNNNGIDFKITGNMDREAEFGEFPWMVAVLKNNYDSNPTGICGGSIISPMVILTGAHCVFMHKTDEILIRAGEWDIQTDKERLPYQERRANQIIVNDKFNPRNLFNDFALIILDKPLKNAEHIATICLPEQDEVINSRNCFATGWGKDVFGNEGRYQSILKKIELPMVPRGSCENALRETRLGKNFVLDSSFICAGGQPGKDACTGDGGSPLVCPDPKNPSRYVQTGIVAWGIGCGDKFPGVYADVAKIRFWIDEIMGRFGLDSQSYIQ